MCTTCFTSCSSYLPIDIEVNNYGQYTQMFYYNLYQFSLREVRTTIAETYINIKDGHF